MKDVLHLFVSQVRALRYWLAAWIIALAAFATARWRFVSAHWEFWENCETAFWAGTAAISLLIAASLVHLHPVAKFRATWRTWPLQRWKVPCAQALFILVFLVLLPAAAEGLFLLHPRLRGFLEHSVRQWLILSLCPALIAAGVAACSTSLRRFLLDAVLIGGVIAVALANPLPFTGSVPALAAVLPAALIVVWTGLHLRRLTTARGRLLLLVASVFSASLPLVLMGVQKGIPIQEYPGTRDDTLSDRIQLEFSPEPFWTIGNPASPLKSVRSLQALVNLTGLEPDEKAVVTFKNQSLTIGDVSVTPIPDRWGQTGIHFGAPAMASSTRSEGTVLSAGADELERLRQNPGRLVAEARVFVEQRVEIVRLPFRTGASANIAGMEILVLFAGSAADYHGRKSSGAGLEPQRLISVISRAVRNHVPRVAVREIDLIHKPSGYRFSNSGGKNEYGSSLFSHVSSTTFTREYSSGGKWADHGLVARTLTDPGEFEIVAGGNRGVGGFSRRIDVENIRLRPPPGNLSSLAIPDVKKEEAVIPAPSWITNLTEHEFYTKSYPGSREHLDAYMLAVQEGREWAGRAGGVIAASGIPDKTIEPYLKAWPPVSDCPAEPAAAREWLRTNADRIHFNSQTRRYELR